MPGLNGRQCEFLVRSGDKLYVTVEENSIVYLSLDEEYTSSYKGITISGSIAGAVYIH
jgi:hypothetical protein